MNRTLFKRLFLLALAIVVVGVIYPGGYGAKELIPWRTDFPAARAEAEHSGKPLLIEFSASWCGYCQQMAHTTFADKNVAAALEKMVPVRVDVDQNHDLALQYGVNPIPAYAVVDASGNILKFGDGYRSAGEFLDWLNTKPPATMGAGK